MLTSEDAIEIKKERKTRKDKQRQKEKSKTRGQSNKTARKVDKSKT